MRIVYAYQDTRSNNEDFALTPYLFSAISIGKIIKIYSIGICWGYFAVCFGVGFNIPKSVSSFWVINKHGNVKEK